MAGLSSPELKLRSPNNGPSTATSTSAQMLRQLVQRLEKVLDEESRHLGGIPFEDLEQVILRKDQLFLELARYAQSVDVRALDAESRVLIERSVKSLDANARNLRRHIDAVGEVTKLITEILSNSNADGTYSIGAAHSRRKL